MRFRSAAIDQIARFICGDSPSPFPYRSATYLANFFSGLGIDVHEKAGTSRNPWCRNCVALANSKDPGGDSPPPEMTLIIEELMNRTYFHDSQSDEVNYSEALRQLNGVLRSYKLEVVPDDDSGLAIIRSVDGHFISTATNALEVARKITFAPSVFNVPKDAVQTDLVSVMIPFSSDFDPVFEAIEKACKANSLQCKRAKDIWKNSTIVQDIFDLIIVSHIVVVDFSKKNSNVFYECGIAHTLGKHVVPLVQNIDDVDLPPLNGAS